jgi:hypothetical protein
VHSWRCRLCVNVSYEQRLWASPTLLATTRVVCVAGLTNQTHCSPAADVIGQQV